LIDYEVQIFNRVHVSVAPLCAKNRVVSTQIDGGTAFPAVSLIEMNNTTVRNRQSSTPVENFARVMYQLEVFARTKSECRAVYAAADSTMIAMNFSRMSGQYIDNADNTKVFRYVARYEAELDPEGNIYRIS
jgi:hypothetical protein